LQKNQNQIFLNIIDDSLDNILHPLEDENETSDNLFPDRSSDWGRKTRKEIKRNVNLVAKLWLQKSEYITTHPGKKTDLWCQNLDKS